MSARILVIEDNRANLELMVYLLGAAGHTVMTATDGRGGIEQIHQARPDVVVCDLQIPGLDGYQVCAWAKRHPLYKSIPIIAVTAYAMVGDRNRALSAGFDGYLPKPINPESFAAQVEAFCDPTAETAPRADMATTAPGAPPVLGRILLVDDSPVNHILVAGTLEPFGYEVLRAFTASAGLEMAREKRPDLILSDIHMPHGNGYELLQAIKADPELKEIPFVFLSSTVWPGKDAELGEVLGADDFIHRPIDLVSLVRRISAQLKRVRKE